VLSRISFLADDSSGSVGTHLAEYTYLGLGMVVKVDYPEPDLRLDLAHGGGADPYDGLDRFDRVDDLLWRNYGASSDAVRIKHGYDWASNRLWREDTVSKSQGTPVYLDEYYTYDGMYQLKNFDRGQLNGGYTGISGTPTKEEDWTLDPLGNWTGFVQKAAGTTSLDQARTVNEANEITNITETVGTAWPTPAYDRNGNSTSFPRPLALGSAYTATYDAWNRLVKLADGVDTVQENAYDGQNWRTVTKLYSGGTLSQTRHQYYSSQWQLVEEREGSATTPDRQWVWGIRYIDDLVLRERDTDANGSVDERLYAMQDPNWNVVAVAGTGGVVQERYSYTPYGVVTKLSASFGASSATIQWNEILYAGYRYDSSTGLYCVRYRYYHPEIGRWFSRDPLLYGAKDANLYRYTQSNPYLGTDSYGLSGPVRIGKWVTSADGICADVGLLDISMDLFKIPQAPMISLGASLIGGVQICAVCPSDEIGYYMYVGLGPSAGASIAPIFNIGARVGVAFVWNMPNADSYLGKFYNVAFSGSVGLIPAAFLGWPAALLGFNIEGFTGDPVDFFKGLILGRPWSATMGFTVGWKQTAFPQVGLSGAFEWFWGKGKAVGPHHRAITTLCCPAGAGGKGAKAADIRSAISTLGQADLGGAAKTLVGLAREEEGMLKRSAESETRRWLAKQLEGQSNHALEVSSKSNINVTIRWKAW
jgi:RHS repeat-associated protein